MMQKENINSNTKSKDQVPNNINHFDINKARKVILDEIGYNVKKTEKNLKDSKPEITKVELKKELPRLNFKKAIKKEFVDSVSMDPKVQYKILINSLIFFIVLSLLISLIGIYLGRWQSTVITNLTRYVPLPAFYVNGQSVKLYDFLGDVNVLEDYLKRQNLETDKYIVRKQVYDKIIELKVIEQLAQKRNITLTNEEINNQLKEILGVDNLSEEVGKITMELYGWDYDMYVEKVVRPILLARKLEEYFNTSQGTNQIREQVGSLYDQLVQNETKFEEIANEVNQDNTKVVSGDLGWFKLGDTVPEFEIVLLQLTEGEVSNVVETRYGFHIIKLNEKMIEEEQPLYHVSHIFLKKPLFNEYLKEQIKEVNLVNLLRI